MSILNWQNRNKREAQCFVTNLMQHLWNVFVSLQFGLYNVHVYSNSLESTWRSVNTKRILLCFKFHKLNSHVSAVWTAHCTDMNSWTYAVYICSCTITHWETMYFCIMTTDFSIPIQKWRTEDTCKLIEMYIECTILRALHLWNIRIHLKQDRQCTCNITYRRVRVTTDEVEKR